MISRTGGWSVPSCVAIEVRKGSSLTGYCLKCREHREIRDPQAVTMKNGRLATRGSCGECGTTMFRIGRANTAGV